MLIRKTIHQEPIWDKESFKLINSDFILGKISTENMKICSSKMGINEILIDYLSERMSQNLGILQHKFICYLWFISSYCLTREGISLL